MAQVNFNIHWYNWSFLDPEMSFQDISCIECHKILEDPMLVECCGTHICKLCAEPLWLSGKLSRCANCDEKHVACIADKSKWKYILNLAILCPLHERGCQWTGTIKGTHDHLSLECPYTIIECTAGCGESIERHESSNHLQNICANRLATCQFCEKNGKFVDIIGDHLLMCSHYYVLCPNGCNEKFLKINYSEHQNYCSECIIPCEYEFAGCKIQLKRKLMRSHLLESISNHSFLQSRHVSQRLQKSVSEQYMQIELDRRIKNYEELAKIDINQLNGPSIKYIEETKLKSSKQIDRITKKINLKIQVCQYKSTQLFNNLEKTIKCMFAYRPNALWEVNSTDIRFEFKLYSGQFDELWSGHKHKDQITIKKLKLGSIAPSKFIQEALMLKQFNHGNILSLVGVNVKSEPILIVMEYIAQTLSSFLTKESDLLTTINQTAIIQQIASGMAHIESLHCIHRAVNSSSVLIGDKLQCKIGNFIFAKILDKDETEYKLAQGERIPIKWSPPEALLHNKFTIKSDVWAFGIIQYEIMNRSPIKMPIMKAEKFIQSGGNLQCPPDCPIEYYKVIKKCLNKDPELRPTFSDLLKEEHLKYNLSPISLDEIIESFPLSDTDSISSNSTCSELEMKDGSVSYDEHLYENLQLRNKAIDTVARQ